MHKIPKKYLTFLIAFALLFANAMSSFAEGVDTQTLANPSPEKTSSTISRPDNTNSQDSQEFINRLNYELNSSKIEYKQLLNNIVDTQQSLSMASEQKVNLLEQLTTVDDNINQANKRLINVMKQVSEQENILKVIYSEIESKEIAIKYQKNLIKDYIRVLYEEEKQYLNVDEDGKINALKMLLSDDSVGDNLKDFRYLNLLNETAQQMIDKLDTLNEELLSYKEEAKVRRVGLIKLQEVFSQQKEDLELQKDSKENLLKVTMGQEQIYSQLLEQTLKDQAESIVEIKALDEGVKKIQQKMAEDGENFDITKYEGLLTNKTKAIYDFQYNSKDGSTTNFIWPVSPYGGLSAYFHDETYRSKFHMDHNAIDIPTMQSSPVRATLDGIVYKAKDNGYGYSYIILAHKGGFSSVYGHISNILVMEGQVVKQNSIIGLSGGMPGTKGAGYMTTGPHLHFEVLAGGIYTDPLKYLDLTKLPLSFILNLPEKYSGDWLKNVYIPSLKGNVAK